VGEPTLKITGAASLGEATPGEISSSQIENTSRCYAKRAHRGFFVRRIFAEPIDAAQVRVFQSNQGVRASRAQICAEANHFRPGIHRVPSSMQALSWPARFDSTASSHRTRCQDWDDNDHWRGSYVGHETIIGSACHIYPNVTIRERSRIGSRVIVHSSAVIGADGFGFEMADGRHQKNSAARIVQIRRRRRDRREHNCLTAPGLADVDPARRKD